MLAIISCATQLSKTTRIKNKNEKEQVGVENRCSIFAEWIALSFCP